MVKVEIENVITQLENCLQLLLPDLETFDLHGLASPEYRPNYNPFRIGSRRRSSTQSNTTKNPVYAPVPSGATEKVPSKLSKGGKRKSSSASESSKTENPKEMDLDKNFDAKGYKDSTDSSSHKIDKKVGKLDNRSPSPTKKRRKSSLDDSCVKLTSGTNDDDAQSENSSDAEDNLEEISDDEDDYLPQSQFVRESGLGSQHYSLNLDLNPDSTFEVVETQDNVDILYNIKDLKRELVNKWLPTVAKWLEVMTKNGAEKALILKAIDVKRHITKVKEKVEKVRVVKSTKKTLAKPSISIESKEDSDSDFEEVPEKEGFEPRIPDHLREEYGLVNKPPKPSTSKDWKLEETTSEYNNVSDPTSWQATVKQIEQKILKESSSPLAKELVQNTGATISPVPKKKTKNPNVPSVPFGTDLLHWGQDVEPPLLVRYESDLKGWVPKGDEQEDVVDINALESRRSRVINFEGEFVPVKWKCRAPMPSGKLCERMDRKKCPFHGQIIARDDQGKPTNPADIARIAEKELSTDKKGGVDWEDEELQADIQAQTGIQLVRAKKGKGKGKSTKYPGLTDLNKTTDSCRKRLQNKVLSTKSMKRVAASLDSVQERKIKDKFGNNYVYAVPQR